MNLNFMIINPIRLFIPCSATSYGIAMFDNRKDDINLIKIMDLCFRSLADLEI